MMESTHLDRLLTSFLEAYRELDEPSKSSWRERIKETLAECDSEQPTLPDKEEESSASQEVEGDGGSNSAELSTEADSSPASVEEKAVSEEVKANDNENEVMPSQAPQASDAVPLLENVPKSRQGDEVPAEVGKSQVPTQPKALPNAVAGRYYEEQVLDFKSHESLRFEPVGDSASLEDFGLAVQDNTLVGTPSQPGEYRFLVSSSIEARKEFVVLLVNPDPKSLWKNLEPPDDAPYPKAHFEGSHLTLEDDAVRIVAGSMRGRSHAHSGTHRDDDFLLATIAPGLYCLAVADGAGSATLSRQGSKLACDSLKARLNSEDLKSDLSFLQSLFSEATAESLAQLDEEGQRELNKAMFRVHLDLVQSAIERIQAEVELTPGGALRDFSTTLLYSIVFRSNGGFTIMNYGIGDGVIAHVQSDRVRLLNTPDGGEFSGQTRFLTMSDSVQDIGNRMKLAFVESLEGLFLMTDGVSDPKFETDSQLTSTAIWGELRTELLSAASNVGDDEIEDWMKEWLSFWSPGNHDDRTIIFVHGFNLKLSGK